jgi:hypothetical protein
LVEGVGEEKLGASLPSWWALAFELLLLGLSLSCHLKYWPLRQVAGVWRSFARRIPRWLQREWTDSLSDSQIDSDRFTIAVLLDGITGWGWRR